MQAWIQTCIAQTCIANTGPGELEFRVVTPGGETRTLRGRGVVRRDAAACAIEMIGTVQDITERVQIETEKRRLEHQLQQAQKMEAIGQLTAGIAHDFNNILASVLGYTELALFQCVPDKTSTLAGYLQQVEAAGLRARDLITNMLAFSRSSPGALQIIQLGLLTKEAGKMLLPTLPSSINFKIDIETDLPTVFADQVQLHQVIMNLVINARDAVAANGQIKLVVRTAPGIHTVCAACHADFAGDFVELAVSDNGPGIPLDVIPHVFEPFYTTKGVGKGTGLGLSVVHGVVHRCGGHILLTSTPGTGTTFSVLLPLSIPEPEIDKIPQDSVTPHHNANRHILVVDDEVSVANLIGAVLDSRGYRVTVFSDSQKALSNFRSAPASIDAVISDQTMPGLTGLELVKAMRALRADLPIILCTGYSAELNPEIAARIGVEFLTKPISFNTLQVTLEKLLGVI